MNIVLTIIGALVGGGIAYIPAAVLIWLSEQAEGKASKTYKIIAGIYLWVIWIPLTLFLVVFFIGRLTNG